MALTYVTLTGSIPGGAGALVTLTPNSWLVSTSTPSNIPPKPKYITLPDDGLGNGLLSVKLLSNDSDPTPAGWSWSIEIDGIEGVPGYGWSFVLNYATAATQDLSSLAEIEPVTPQSPNFPKFQGVQTAQGVYSTHFAVQPSGGTDGAGPFGLVSGGQTYGGILGHAWWFGYNALNLASGAAGAQGAAGFSFFADAGDTNVGGAHGIEINIGFVGPGGLPSQATNAFQMVAVDDNSNSLYTTLRCGTGTEGAGSGISLLAGAATPFAIFNMANQYPIALYRNTFLSPPSGPAALVVQAAAGANASTLQLSSGNSATVAQILFQQAGVSQWNMSAGGGVFALSDLTNGNPQIYVVSGGVGGAAAATTYMFAVVQCEQSLVTAPAALGTAATVGHLYIPTCAGPPTGIPVVHAGTAALILDSVNHKLYTNDGVTGWKGVAVS